MNKEDIEFWSNISKIISREAQKVLEPLLGTNEGGKVVKMGADGTPTKYH